MKRLLMIVIVLAVIGGTWVLYSRANQPTTTAPVAMPEGYATAPVTLGAIEATISATGNVLAEQSISLSFATSGTVSESSVREGDRVTAGQVLARLDARDLELSVKQAEASLLVSEAQLAKTRTKASVEEIKAAEVALASAKASLADLRRGTTEADKELARLGIDQAKNSLWAAQGSRDAVKGNKFTADAQIDQAEAAVLNAEVAVKIAELQYAQLSEPPKASAIASAQAQIAQAEASLARLMNAPAAEDIAMAESQVAQARIGVEVASARLADMTLTAPSDGVLATWKLNVGDTATPGNPVGTLIDDSRHHITVAIDETEITRITLDQSAVVSLDAYPDQKLEGTVAGIELVGNSSQGIVSYNVRVNLDAAGLALRPGMTSAVEIVVDRKESVLLVPNRAIRRDRDGKYVEIMVNAVPKKVYITTGVTDQENAEVLTGLEEGQEIIVTRPRQAINAFGG